DDYHDEFDAVFKRRDITNKPTVYLCAQDRGENTDGTPDGPERMLLLVNAPADGDRRDFDQAFVDEIDARAEAVMQGSGLTLRHDDWQATTPQGFNGLFPATGGALYGRATHGPFATFSRTGATTKVRGLFVAGGSAHPGPGIPMATMSGRLAAQAAADVLSLADTPVPA
ncbi:MAG: CrtD protein, partial [Pseudomonadota bacterium]